ncbi:MAG TPA: pyrimidine dimer DNA glycosylase/endonuclease V [Patescibacteria group bacterium]|nr:pyrimidine dimer DNA glycosylase/endonuclease V [Patescibacteria group bacterium]
MRLWSIHPKYLDRQGILAVWREGLLAQRVLQNKTKGYKNHPQLIRFKKLPDPVKGINNYLHFVYLEAKNRGYKFDKNKKPPHLPIKKIAVSQGQIDFEFQHLLKKLQARSPKVFENLKHTISVEPHPSFKIIVGDKAEWEKS